MELPEAYRIIYNSIKKVDSSLDHIVPVIKVRAVLCYKHRIPRSSHFKILSELEQAQLINMKSQKTMEFLADEVGSDPVQD